MRGERRGRPPVRPPRARRSTRRAPLVEAAGPALQGGDPRRPRRAGARRPASRCPVDLLLRARAVQRPVQGAARRHAPAGSARSSSCPSPAPTGAATRSGRCCSASTARSGRPRRSWTATCGGARRRRSATTAGWASQLDLFSFHDVSPGSAFWHPKGWRLWRTLETRHARAPGAAAATRRSSTPIARPPEALGAVRPLGPLPRATCSCSRRRSQTFSLKPMNCPESTFIYRSRAALLPRPARCGSPSTAGSTATSGPACCPGLTRVRHFVQDDAHIYVRPDQLGAEIEALLGEVREAYGWFGLEPRFTFGTRPDKALGDPALWERAEALIRERARAVRACAYRVKPRDGAFYAPEDRHPDRGRPGARVADGDDPGRPVMLPERFDLTYIDEDGQPQRPIAIHRAIYGSLERFIGILVEHFAGAFPLWCAPVQAVVIPIADRHVEAGRRAGGAPARARAARGGRRLGQPDAEQDPPGPGAEGPLHARPGRPRGGGADRGRADARRRAAAGRGLGGARRAAGRGGCARPTGGAPVAPIRRSGGASPASPAPAAGGDCAILRRRTAPGSRVLRHAVRRAHRVNSRARRGRR